MNALSRFLGTILLTLFCSTTLVWAQSLTCENLFETDGVAFTPAVQTERFLGEPTPMAELASLMKRINSFSGTPLPEELKELQKLLAVLNEEDWMTVYTLTNPEQMEMVLNSIYSTPQSQSTVESVTNTLPAIEEQAFQTEVDSETSTDFPGLDRIESELGLALMGQESETQITRGGGLVGFMRRVFRHPLFPYRTLLAYNNQVRARLTYAQLLQNAMEEVLKKEKPDLDPTLQRRLEALYVDLDGIRDDVDQEILKVYGYNVLDTSVPVPSQFNVHDASVTIHRNGYFQDTDRRGDYIEEAVQIVREFNSILNAARAAKGLPERGPKDWSATELNVLNVGARSDVESKADDYRYLMNRESNADIVVRFSYYIRDMNPDNDNYPRPPNWPYPGPIPGNGRFLMFDSESVSLSYKEVLIDRVNGYRVGTLYSPDHQPHIPYGYIVDSPYTIVEVHGRSRLLKDSAEAAQQEDGANDILTAFGRTYDLIQSHGEYFEQVKDRPQLKAERLREIDQAMGEVERLEETISSLLNSRPVWNDDSSEHRQQRFRALLNASHSTQLLLSIYREQVERDQKTVSIETRVLDHSQTLKTIRGRFRRFVLGHVGGWTFAVAAGCLGANYIGLECLPGMWENILPFLNIPRK